MSEHRLFVANGQYPRFSGSPAFGPRAKPIAQAVLDSGADCAVFGEMGYRECSALAEHLDGWQYDRAQGKGRGVLGEGLNSVWSKTSVFRQPEDRLSDYNLPSFGQWQRTALLARLEEVGDPSAFAALTAVHFAAVGAPLGRAGADRAKLAQIKYLTGKVGDRRTAWAGDIPRTDSADDLAWIHRQGMTVVGRTSSTPLCVVVHGAIRITSVTERPHGRLFDHNYKVVGWSVAGEKEKAA